jgi:putative autotransporter adhesin-like protein
MPSFPTPRSRAPVTRPALRRAWREGGLAALVGAGALLGSGCIETFDGNGIPVDEQRDLRGFDRVTSRGVLEVSVTEGAFAVAVHIDQNLLSRLSTTVSGDTLVIQAEGGNLGDLVPGPHVTIAMPSLLGADLRGTGSFDAKGFDEQQEVSVALSGSGKMSWSGDASSLDAVLNGNGTLELEGSAESVDYHLAGAGSLDARDLTAGGADIQVDGAGSVTATVDGRVDAKVTGTGSIELLGDVTKGSWIEAEGGTITGP